MYETTIPAREEMVDTIRNWVRNLAQATHPEIADAVQDAAAALAGDAIRRNQPTATVTVRTTVLKAGLRLEVQDPGGGEHAEGDALVIVSRLAREFGARRDKTGHMAWAEISCPSVSGWPALTAPQPSGEPPCDSGPASSATHR